MSDGRENTLSAVHELQLPVSGYQFQFITSPVFRFTSRWASHQTTG
jgi:hypothetical protein